MRRLGLLLLVCTLGAYGPGTTAPSSARPACWRRTHPRNNCSMPERRSFKDRYRIKALAEFTLEARVLGREDYRFDSGADLAPLDLALGWGRCRTAMCWNESTSNNATALLLARQRFFLPRRDIETHSANMHLIPATGYVADRLKLIRPGHIVSLRGYLVEAHRDDGWQWRSSLSRGTPVTAPAN